MPERHREVTVSGDPERQLHDLLGPYSLSAIIDCVAAVTAARIKDRGRFEAIVSETGRDHRVTFRPRLLRQLATVAISQSDQPDMGQGTFPPNTLAQAEELIFEINARKDRLASDATPEDRYALALRVLQPQLHDQLNHAYYYRNLAILRQAIGLAATRSLDVNGAFRSQFGLSFDDLAFLSFTFFAYATGNPGRRLSTRKTNLNPPLTIDAQSLDAFWDHCSLDYAQFRENANHPAVVPRGYEIYALSPLVKWPVIVHPDETSSIPIATDMLDRTTGSFHIDIQDFLTKEELSAFGNAYGETLQNDVGDTLKECKGAGTVHDASEFVPQDQKACDFICDEGRSLTLVEVKSARVSLRADQTKLRNELKTEYAKEGGVAEGVVQINETAKAIRQGRTRFKKGISINALLIISGEGIGLNSDYSRGIIEEILEERSEERAIVKYHIASEPGFQDLVGAIQKETSLGDYLYRKARSNEKVDDLHVSVRKRYPNLAPLPLMSSYRANFNDLLQRYGYTPQAQGKRTPNPPAPPSAAPNPPTPDAAPTPLAAAP